MKKVTIWIGGEIIGSINDDVVYGQPDFKKAVEHVDSAANDVDFGCLDNDHAEENAETKKVGGLPKKKKNGTLDVVTVVNPNVLRDIAFREIEERVLTETGNGGNSDEEGLETDLHNNAVRPRVKLGVPNFDLDTENLDVEYIEGLIGEPWWHMRAPGAAIPGLSDGWMPPKAPDN